jgi:hypothetical protein
MNLTDKGRIVADDTDFSLLVVKSVTLTFVILLTLSRLQRTPPISCNGAKCSQSTTK